MTLSIRTMLAGAVLVAVGTVVVGGFLAVGSPMEARLRRLDGRRISDLRQAVTAVNVYWTRTHTLPPSLLAAREEAASSVSLTDPVTEQPYEYRVTGGVKDDGKEFELCATFDRGSHPGAQTYPGDPFWSHTSGRQCFTLTARDLAKGQDR